MSSPGARRLPTGHPSSRLGGKPPIGSRCQTYEGGSDPHCRGEEIRQARGAALRSISSSCDTDRDFVHASVFFRVCLSNTLHAGSLAILPRLPRWNTTGVCMNRDLTPHTIHSFVERQATAESWRLPAVSGREMPCPYHDVNIRVVRCCEDDTSGVENLLLSPLSLGRRIVWDGDIFNTTCSRPAAALQEPINVEYSLGTIVSSHMHMHMHP